MFVIAKLRSGVDVSGNVEGPAPRSRLGRFPYQVAVDLGSERQRVHQQKCHREGNLSTVRLVPHRSHELAPLGEYTIPFSRVFGCRKCLRAGVLSVIAC